ncbi:hypothetical protein D3C72_1125880 [compost metagenome]
MFIFDAAYDFVGATSMAQANSSTSQPCTSILQTLMILIALKLFVFPHVALTLDTSNPERMESALPIISCEFSKFIRSMLVGA